MVMTVEPGLYIDADAKGVAKRWRGIGIRIEDDVLVTRGAPMVLTDAVPKDPDRIEQLMQQAYAGQTRPPGAKLKPRGRSPNV